MPPNAAARRAALLSLCQGRAPGYSGGRHFAHRVKRLQLHLPYALP